MSKEKENTPEMIIARINRYLRHAWWPNWKVAGPWWARLISELEARKSDGNILLYDFLPDLLRKFSFKKIAQPVLQLTDSPFKVDLLQRLIKEFYFRKQNFQRRAVNKCAESLLSSPHVMPFHVSTAMQVYNFSKCMEKVESLAESHLISCLDLLAVHLIINHDNDAANSYHGQQALQLFRKLNAKLSDSDLESQIDYYRKQGRSHAVDNILEELYKTQDSRRERAGKLLQ